VLGGGLSFIRADRRGAGRDAGARAGEALVRTLAAGVWGPICTRRTEHRSSRSPTGGHEVAGSSRLWTPLWTPLWAPRRGSSWTAGYRGARPALLTCKMCTTGRENLSRTAVLRVRLPAGRDGGLLTWRERLPSRCRSRSTTTPRRSSSPSTRCTRCAGRRRGGPVGGGARAGTIGLFTLACCVHRRREGRGHRPNPGKRSRDGARR